jgi:hypothetical protein
MRSFKRLALVAGAATGMLWIASFPALAKGLPGEEWPAVRTVVVEGGSGPLIAFSGEQAADFARSTGMEDATQPQALDLRGLTPPKGSALGPRFQVMYVFSPAVAARVGLPGTSVTQDLYPFAKGAPWAFTPSGQGLHAFGWWPVGTDVIQMLKGAGLTARAVAVTSTASSPTAPSASRWELWLALGVVALLGMTAAIAARRSSSPAS